MRVLTDELRLALCDLLVGLILRIVPDNPEGKRLVARIGRHSARELATNFRRQFAVGKHHTN